ncbi:MAG: hypothetical protein Q9217_002590 [Psora testacea]
MKHRKFVIHSSDDESDNEQEGLSAKTTKKVKASAPPNVEYVNNYSQQSLPTRTLPKATSEPKNAPMTARLRPRRPSNKVLHDRSSKAKLAKDSTRSISTFFSVNTGGQQPKVRTQRPARQNGEALSEMLDNERGEEEEEDVIEDDSPSEKVDRLPAMRDTTRLVLDRRKQMDEMGGTKEKPPSASQRFRIPARGKGKDKLAQNCSQITMVDSRPWAERYGPTSLEELAVHKKKITDVRTWLENVLLGNDCKRLLILRGPSGAGKTATLGLLAKNMHCELCEWRNPVGSDFLSEGYSSMSAQFDDFLGRSGRFGKLDLSAEGLEPTSVASLDSKATSEPGRRNIILLEEFPNTFSSASAALSSFRCSIMEYLSTKTPSMGAESSRVTTSGTSITPVVMIITETKLTTTTAASDSFTAHRLLGSDILSHPGVSVIDFNPIATTFLSKALELVLEKEARQSGGRRKPGPSLLKRLGEVGDIRSAIGSLEFLSVRGNDGDGWNERGATKRKKGPECSPALTETEKISLQMVTQRESTLGLFHSVGKVVYNKREEAKAFGDDEWYMVQPPQHLSSHARMRTSQVSIDQLIGGVGTDTETFIAALHENYVMSCEGPSFVDSLNGCLDALSDVDIFSSPCSGRFGSDRDYGKRAFQETAADRLKHEISFQLAVRGLLFALPDPVRRGPPPTGVPSGPGGRGDPYKIFYPTTLRLWRQMEEAHHLVDRWVTRLQFSTVMLQDGGQHEGVKVDAKGDTGTDGCTTTQSPDSGLQEPHRTCLNVTRTELIAERVPYISKIKHRYYSSGPYRELESITQFHGINLPEDAYLQEDLADTPSTPAADLTADQPVEGAMHAADFTLSWVKPREESQKASTYIVSEEEELGKLYLTDDDIEDD